MPYTYYVPRPDAEFDSWFQKYQFYAVANAVALGLTPAEALEIQTAKIVWSLAFSAHLAAKDAARGAAETKDEKREAAEVVIRLYTGKIQARRETTDAQREGLGVTVPDREPTPLPPEAILLHPPPLYKVDTGLPVTVTYRLRYVDRLGRPGPFGPPVTVTISA